MDQDANRWNSRTIKELRGNLGLTQKDFGEILNVHVVTVIRWEGGSSEPSPMACKLLDVLSQQQKRTAKSDSPG